MAFRQLGYNVCLLWALLRLRPLKSVPLVSPNTSDRENTCWQRGSTTLEMGRSKIGAS